MSEYEGVDLDTDYEEMVVGYIVGACDRTMKNALFTIDEIRASGVNSNVLIADSKDERDASRCMPIELKRVRMCGKKPILWIIRRSWGVG